MFIIFGHMHLFLLGIYLQVEFLVHGVSTYYLVKDNGTSFTNSVIFNDAGGLGIGNTDPSYRLDVNGDISTGNGGMRWKTFSGTAGTNVTTFSHGLTASKIIAFPCQVTLPRLTLK